MDVIKKDQTKEPFNEEKVISSIKRANIPESLQYEVLHHIKQKLYDGISTDEIYHHIIEFLGASPHPYSKSKYSLKESIMNLGPTGYPFEDFISDLLMQQGYTTKVRQILNGKCITHEIDVIAKKDNKTIMIEAKFHNRPGVKSEVHVGLYTHARFQDIKEENHLDEAWLVTNTKTTSDCNIYAQCSGMKILSWDYPKNGGLREMIEKSKLHPITILDSLSQANKMILLTNHIVLCRDIYTNPQVLQQLPLSKTDIERVISEVSVIGNY